MRANDAHTATCALEICISWRDGTLLRQEHLCPPRDYVLRERGTGDDEAEFVVQREWLDGPEHPLVHVEASGVTVHSPAGSIRLRQGERAAVQIGPLTFAVQLAEAIPLGAAVRASTLQPRQHVWTAASFALHLLGLACMALLPPKASSLSLDALDADTRYARYLMTPVAPDALPWSDGAQGGAAEDAGEAARQAGDEGRSGSERAPRSEGRLAIPGRSPQRVVPKLSASNAGQQGILGVLPAALAAVSSPFGAESLQGSDYEAAMGALFGARVGENFGLGGLGMRGTGRGGGGDAVGVLGVGELDTGAGARGALGTGTMAGMRRESHVPKLRMGDAAVRGSLSKEAIRRVIHRNLAQVRYCYERTLSTRPDLSGRVAIQFMISPSGVVQQSHVAESSLGDAALDGCVADAVRRWTFPAPDGGGYVHVTYPFVFERTGG